MKVAVCSDLHLEFGDIDLKNTENADVLILSGDILIAEHLHDHIDIPTSPYGTIPNVSQKMMSAKRYRDFLKRCSVEFPNVVYVAGNHEFYNGKWYAGLDYIREETLKHKNVIFMENETKKIGDFYFIGCTLWTDLNKNDQMTSYDLSNYMNDYRVIRNDREGFRRLHPDDTYNRHLQSIKYIRDTLNMLDYDAKVIIVGHHAPSKQSTHPRYAEEYTINGGYSSDLSELILDNPRIKLWTHGHTHEPFDYMIGETRIVCNPRGYDGYEESADRFKLKFVDV